MFLCLLMNISLFFDSVEQTAKAFHQQQGGNCQLASQETALTLPTFMDEGSETLTAIDFFGMTEVR